MKAILVTLIAGLFFVLGAIIALLFKKKNFIVEFSLGMAFTVMICLLVFDILPETIELMQDYNKLFIFLFVVIGIILLKIMDLFVPHHDHDKEKEHHENHLHHIGLISVLALAIHNIIEGIGIYSIAEISLKSGLIMAFAVGLHNVPFGIEIMATLNDHEKNKTKTIIYLLIATLSTSLGGIILMLFSNINSFILGSLMSITIGMIIYLVIFELLGEIKHFNNKKNTIIGGALGILIIVLTLLLD